MKTPTLLVLLAIGTILLLNRCAEDVPPVSYPSVDASFSTQYQVVLSGELVNFKDQSTGEPTEWQWSFEGGTPATSTEANPQVQYEQSGSYPVKLIVRNAGNVDTLVQTNYVHVFSPTANQPAEVSCPTQGTGQSATDQVNEQPRPADGIDHFYRYLAHKIVYPDSARKYGVEGKVFVQFIVGDTGNLGCVDVIRGIGYGCDEEAAQAVESFPHRWLPGRRGSQLVNTRLVVPITFKLG